MSELRLRKDVEIMSNPEAWAMPILPVRRKRYTEPAEHGCILPNDTKVYRGLAYEVLVMSEMERERLTKAVYHDYDSIVEDGWKVVEELT